jgi:hypothetical protein
MEQLHPVAQCLDHLILFVPCDPESRTPIIPSYFKDNFTLTPGGTHADGLTANTLILFEDGCYIELICFLPQLSNPTGIFTHWWGPDPNRKGWADWCLTNNQSPNESWERFKSTYSEPISGGRKRPDGKDVKWAVTFPKGENGGQQIRGKVPFFCHDITPRDSRVPITKESVKHPCGALYVSRLTVIVETEEELEKTMKVYNDVTGHKFQVFKKRAFCGQNFGFSKVKEVLGMHFGPDVTLRLPENDEERAKVKGRGFWYGDVVVDGEAGEGREEGPPIRLDNGDDDLGGFWLEYTERQSF